MTSVSLLVWKIEPWASSRCRISCAFTRLPLWASAIMPLFDCTMMGWALKQSRIAGGGVARVPDGQRAVERRQARPR